MPNFCSVEGCGRTATTRKMCPMHYMRWLRHGDPTVLKKKKDTKKTAYAGEWASHKKEWSCYNSMMSRCYCKKHTHYMNYGGRGITVCERWRGEKGLHFFIEDMGPRPEGYTLDRIDNNKGYSPDNCRWASRKQQANNTRLTIRIEYAGKSKTLSEWAELSGLTVGALYQRLYAYKWPSEKALNTPLRKKRSRR